MTSSVSSSAVSGTRRLDLPFALARARAAAPAFLTLILMRLTFSITQGLVWGILTYVLLHVAVVRLRQIPLALWLVAVGCAAVLVADYL